MQYDTVLKRLLAEAPASWAKLLGVEEAVTLTLVDTEFQTVQATVDKLIRVEGEYTWLIHIEFQAGYHAKIGLRIVRYSTIIEHETGLPVQSVLVLLSPDADGPAANGIVERRLPFRKTWYDEFRFDVIRLWQVPVEPFLRGGLGTLALAPICDLRGHDLSEVIQVVKARVDAEITDTAERNEFWASVEILLGSVYDANFIKSLLKGFANMRESSIVLDYIEEGHKKGLEEGLVKGLERGLERGMEKAREELLASLLKLGTRFLGAPSEAIRQQLKAITDSGTLSRLAGEVPDAESWDNLLCFTT